MNSRSPGFEHRFVFSSWSQVITSSLIQNKYCYTLQMSKALNHYQENFIYKNKKRWKEIYLRDRIYNDFVTAVVCQLAFRWLEMH